jgi:uncharacterized membrane protein
MLNYGHLLMVSDAVLILGGATMYWLSPRLRRNWVLGYGSRRSMINDAAWQAGNRFAGMTLALLALVAMFLLVSLRQGIESNDLAQAFFLASTLSLPFLVMFLTEKHLARAFRN